MPCGCSRWHSSEGTQQSVRQGRHNLIHRGPVLYLDDLIVVPLGVMLVLRLNNYQEKLSSTPA